MENVEVHHEVGRNIPELRIGIIHMIMMDTNLHYREADVHLYHHITTRVLEPDGPTCHRGPGVHHHVPIRRRGLGGHLHHPDTRLEATVTH